MQRGGQGTRAPRVLCVFLDAPVDASAMSIRWRRLAQFVCTLGQATAIVATGLAADAELLLSAQLGAPVIALDIPRLGRWSGLAKALTTPWRSWPPTRLDVAAARDAIADQVAEHAPDVVWCAGAEAWLALPKKLRRRAVVDFMDLPSRNRRELASVAMHRLGRRMTNDGGVDASVFVFARDVQGGLRNRWIERHVARRAAAVIVASPTEVHGHPGFHCVPTGVEDPGTVAPPADEHAVPHFVFPGSFLYPPHQDAAEWFALYVLPPLRQLLPMCRVVFAGECPEWMRSFGQLHGIEVTGPIDPGDVLDGRSVVIAPIRSGSGTVVEVIDAWARGVPVVATSRAVEGLDPHDGDDVLVGDDPAEFAARCSMAASYPELRARLSAHGRARYEAGFTWDGIGADLLGWLRSLPVDARR
ncbi:MAG: glycosyltransferase [Ilumatobacteraceae bacterium]